MSTNTSVSNGQEKTISSYFSSLSLKLLTVYSETKKDLSKKAKDQAAIFLHSVKRSVHGWYGQDEYLQ